MKPLIFDYKVERVETDFSSVYFYDRSTSLNMINTSDGPQPFIDMKESDFEMITKTRVLREDDDESFYMNLGTETKIAREESDRSGWLQELETKTFVKREADDERSTDF
jgi:hypothetical protein